MLKVLFNGEIGRVSMADFFSSKRFFDDMNFPYGFERSGEFSSTQAKLLTLHGRAYRALENGDQEPKGENESNFSMFCNGLREAETQHEKAWKKYREACGRIMEYHSVAVTRPTDYAETEMLDIDAD